MTNAGEFQTVHSLNEVYADGAVLAAQEHVPTFLILRLLITSVVVSSFRLAP